MLTASLAAEPGGVVAVVLPPAEVDPHGTLRRASETYRAAIEAIGLRSVTVDLGRFGPAELDALRAARPGAVFSDGGWVHRMRVEEHGTTKPLSEWIGVPVVTLINDNPCSPWLPPILGRDHPDQTTAFLDPDFSTLWERWVPKRGRHRVYVPACPPMPDPPPDAERDIAVLTALTFRPPEALRGLLSGHSKDPAMLRLYEAVVETGLADPLAPVSAVCDAACAALDVRLDLARPEHRLVVYLADQHIRNERRRRMIERLADRPITLVGTADGLRLHPGSRVLPPVPNGELMALYRRARVVLACPPYSGGVSERLTHAMAAGALVVAPPTTLSDTLFGRDRVFVTVAGNFDDLADGLRRAEDPDTRRRLLTAARTEVVQRFTPEALMRDLLSGIAKPAAIGAGP